MTTTTDAPDLVAAEPAAPPPGALTVLMRTRPELVLAPMLLVVILAAWGLIFVYVRWTNRHYDHAVADLRRAHRSQG